MADDKVVARKQKLPIYEGGYTTIPAFFIDELMPYANGIPASFWKYMMVLWRDVFGANHEAKGYTTDKVMTQFHITKETAMQWTAALSVSGVFSVFYGVRHRPNEPGIPTKITYLPQSTVEDWKCFITALRDTILASKRKNLKVQRDGIAGFRIDLSFRVDNERQRIGLPRCYDAWHKKLVESGEIKKLDDCNFQWSHPRTKRSGLMSKEDKEFLDLQMEEVLGPDYKDRL
jgi:hypothetical protein